MSDKCLKGGLSDGFTLEDIAKKHSVSIDILRNEFEKGKKVELEHTNNKEMASKIAMDHLMEDPKYYSKLKKMEAKESVGADAAGSFVSKFNQPIMKKDIHKFNLKEATGSDVSAGASYDAPIGHKQKDPLSIDKPTKSASITASKNTRAVKDKNFPKFGGPETKFVEIDGKCTKFPYCNQGDMNKITMYESSEVQKAIQEASKKYGVPVKDIQKWVLNEIEMNETLPRGLWDAGNEKAISSWTEKPGKTFHIETEEPISLNIRNETDLAKLKLLLYKYDVKFKISEVEDINNN